jgi:hypothetical protein
MSRGSVVCVTSDGVGLCAAATGPAAYGSFLPSPNTILVFAVTDLGSSTNFGKAEIRETLLIEKTF